MPNQVYAETDSKQKEINSSMEPFIWLLITVGSCIIVVLLYVSWKKYRGEIKGKVKQKKKKGSE